MGNQECPKCGWETYGVECPACRLRDKDAEVDRLKKLWHEATKERDRYKVALEKIYDDFWHKNGFIPAGNEQVRRFILVDRLNEVGRIAYAALNAPRVEDRESK